MDQEESSKDDDLVRIWEELKGARHVHPVGLGWLFFQYLKSGLIGNPTGSLATLLLLILAVLLAGIFFVVSSPLAILLVSQGTHVPVKVYFNQVVDRGNAHVEENRIVQRVKELPGVKRVDLISGEEAIQGLQRELGEGHPIFRSLDVAGGERAEEKEEEHGAMETILPDRIHVYLQPGSEQDELAQVLRQELKGEPLVQDVRFESKLVSTIREFSKLLVRLGTILAMGIFSSAFLLVIVSMQLRYLLRADEVGVMRLVGATFPFIVAPLYLEAALLGLIAGVTGLVAVRVFQSALLHEVFLVFPHLAERGDTLTLGFFPLVALLVAPLAVALFGTWLATRLLRNER